MTIKNNLEKIAASIIGTEYLLCYNNYNGLHASGLTSYDRFSWLPIENSYFGDTPEIFASIVASSFIGDKIKKYGNNSLLTFCGKHFPELTAAAIGMYYTLGETIMPYLLPGTADLKDVPAVLITAIASPIVARKITELWQEKDIVLERLQTALSTACRTQTLAETEKRTKNIH